MPKKESQARRQFIKKAVKTLGVGIVATTATKALAAPAIITGKQQWKMVLTWQKVLPGLGTGAVRLANRISRLSNGKLEIKVYGGGELVPPQGVFDAVSQGVAEMGHSAPYYWLSKHKASAFFCALPAGLTAQEQKGWLYFGGGQKLWDRLYAPFGLKAFPAGNTGVQMGGWFKKEVNSLKDIRGLKMRIPGIGGEVFSKLGGSAQTIPPQELFTAMQSGVIDAVEWVGPWNDLALGFHRVSKVYYGPGFQEAGANLELMVNKKAYDGLSKELQLIIKCACATENELMAAEYHANNIKAYNTLKKKYNVDIRPYPKEVMEAFLKTSNEVVAEIGQQDKISREIYESYHQYKEYSIKAGAIAERAYLNTRDTFAETSV